MWLATWGGSLSGQLRYGTKSTKRTCGLAARWNTLTLTRPTRQEQALGPSGVNTDHSLNAKYLKLVN